MTCVYVHHMELHNNQIVETNQTRKVIYMSYLADDHTYL